MAKAKRKPTTKKAPKHSGPSDNTQAIIRECINYSQNIAAFHAAFDGSPAVDSDSAEKYGDPFADAAMRSLEKLGTGKMLATTPLAIEAKARIVKIIFDDNGLSLEPREKAFFEQFGFEVKNYLAGVNGRAYIAERKKKQEQEQKQKKGK